MSGTVGAAARQDEADADARRSSMYADSSVPVPEPQRVPIATERPAHQVLEEMLFELRSLTARASAGESRSSATIKSSARGVDLEVKSYADGLLPDAVGDALAQYARGQRELAALQAHAWQMSTVP